MQYYYRTAPGRAGGKWARMLEILREEWQAGIETVLYTRHVSLLDNVSPAFQQVIEWFPY